MNVKAWTGYCVNLTRMSNRTGATNAPKLRTDIQQLQYLKFQMYIRIELEDEL